MPLPEERGEKQDSSKESKSESSSSSGDDDLTDSHKKHDLWLRGRKPFKPTQRPNAVTLQA